MNKSSRNCWLLLAQSLVLLVPLACRQPPPDNKALTDEIGRLQRRLDSVYKPGLGEFMSGIQVHHEKLWFAGKAGNWPLAGFEIGELKESVDDIRQFCTDRPEVASLPMIGPALDSLDAAIKAAEPDRFSRAFTLLTNTCNNCHKATKHEFNVIRIPESPPFSNQVFTPPGH